MRWVTAVTGGVVGIGCKNEIAIVERHIRFQNFASIHSIPDLGQAQDVGGYFNARVGIGDKVEARNFIEFAIAGIDTGSAALPIIKVDRSPGCRFPSLETDYGRIPNLLGTEAGLIGETTD